MNRGDCVPDVPDVEVSDQGRKYHEHSVFFHEREGQMFPAEVVVLHVEGTLRRAALVVELVVVVERHRLLFVDHAELQQCLEQLVVQPVVDVEPVALPRRSRRRK